MTQDEIWKIVRKVKQQTALDKSCNYGVFEEEDMLIQVKAVEQKFKIVSTNKIYRKDTFISLI